MAEYAKVFDNPYPNGWENLPSETTPITASALQEHTDAIEHIETYLDENPIKAVPTKLSELKEDETHRTVTDAEKQAWNNKGGASTWSEVENKPFESIGEGLKVENNMLKTTGSGGLPDLAGTKAEFEEIKDSLPDGSAFDTTDEIKSNSIIIPSSIELFNNNVYKQAIRGMGTGLSIQIPLFKEPKSISGTNIQYYQATTSSGSWVNSGIEKWSWDSNILTVAFLNPPSTMGIYGLRGTINIVY